MSNFEVKLVRDESKSPINLLLAPTIQKTKIMHWVLSIQQVNFKLIYT